MRVVAVATITAVRILAVARVLAPSNQRPIRVIATTRWADPRRYRSHSRCRAQFGLGVKLRSSPSDRDSPPQENDACHYGRRRQKWPDDGVEPGALGPTRHPAAPVRHHQQHRSRRDARSADPGLDVHEITRVCDKLEPIGSVAIDSVTLRRGDLGQHHVVSISPQSERKPDLGWCISLIAPLARRHKEEGRAPYPLGDSLPLSVVRNTHVKRAPSWRLKLFKRHADEWSQSPVDIGPLASRRRPCHRVHY